MDQLDITSSLSSLPSQRSSSESSSVESSHHRGRPIMQTGPRSSLRPVSSPPWSPPMDIRGLNPATLTPPQQTRRPWQESPNRRSIIPPEQTKRWKRTRGRIFQAISPAVDTTGAIAHDVLEVASGVLVFAGIPGLESAAKLLLQIWDNIQLVESNRLACLRLAERCADILIAIRGEVYRAKDEVIEELRIPMLKLEDTFMTIYGFIQQYGQQPFYKRYIHKDEMLAEISNCNMALQDCLEQFKISISVAILEHVLKLAEMFTPNPSPSGTPMGSPSPSYRIPNIIASSINTTDALDDLDLRIRALPRSPTLIEEGLRKIQEDQNIADRTRDMDDLRQTLQKAVDAQSDTEMISILQVAKDDLPEALKLLLQSYERRNSLMSSPNFTSGSPRWITSPPLRSSSWPLDGDNATKLNVLDRDFMEKEISALKRAVDDLITETYSENLTKKDVQLGQVIGRGYFSSVYKGKWNRRAIAVKVLMSTSSISAFVNERNVWKSVKHSNIIPLLAASDVAEACTGSRFFLSPFMKNGSLTDYLKRLEWEGASVINVLPLKIMHDIAKGMEYLHNARIFHGDLRAYNVLVDDDYVCRVADFGQSKFASTITYKDPVPHHALRWQPPEILSGRSTLLTEWVDSYAYAITCSEVLNMGNIPWPDLYDDLLKLKVLDLGERPMVSWEVADSLQVSDIIKACWDDSPARRLSFRQIVRKYDDLQPQSSSSGSSPLIVVSPEGEQINLSYSDEDFHHSLPHDVEPVVPLLEITQDTYLDMEETSEYIYRNYLCHEFSVSLKLPLWSPSAVSLGDVGYLEKRSGKFVKLFSSLDPQDSSDGRLGDIPKLTGFGSVPIEFHSLHKKNITKRGLDRFNKHWSSHRGSQEMSPLPRIRHEILLKPEAYSAHLITSDDATYAYIGHLRACKQWFKAYCDEILLKYNIKKGDLILVVQTLSASNYALLVNHGIEREQKIYFDEYGFLEPSQKWGTFMGLSDIVDISDLSEAGQNISFVSNVSSIACHTKNDMKAVVLIGRLRFQAGIDDPTLI
ncbi:hypothetical protein BDQ17DRAFT_1284877 [Cyathus striatus]|nr:hypothetical protein BDQ17DRAFT_1284877 [Cyathus striatus]